MRIRTAPGPGARFRAGDSGAGPVAHVVAALRFRARPQAGDDDRALTFGRVMRLPEHPIEAVNGCVRESGYLLGGIAQRIEPTSLCRGGCDAEGRCVEAVGWRYAAAA